MGVRRQRGRHDRTAGLDPLRPRAYAPRRATTTMTSRLPVQRGTARHAPPVQRLHVAEGYGSGPRARGAHHTNEPSSTSSKIPTKRASHVYVVVFKKSADAPSLRSLGFSVYSIRP